MLLTEPRLYQLEGARRLAELQRGLLADVMGLGKTLQALMVLEANPKLRPAVVVCPASLKWNWRAEAKNHIGMRTVILEKRKPPRHIRWSTKDLIVINYDILLGDWLKVLKALKPKVIILDEAHYVANRNAGRSKAVRRLCRGVPNVMALTGTPVLNRPAELWHLLHILAPKEYTSFWGFAQIFCAPKRTPWGWDVRGASNLNLLNRKLKKIMVRRTHEDVLEQLPKKIRSVVTLPIDRPERYDLATRRFVEWIMKEHPDKARKALKAEGLVKVGYLKRLAAKLKWKYMAQWIDNFLAENSGKIVLFAVHKFMIKRLRKRYAKECVVVDGSVVGEARHKAVVKFQNNPKCRVFIGNIKAAGVGLNLTAAETIAFLEFPWVPGELTQAEARCYARIGDLHGARIYFLVAHATLEPDLLRILRRKQRNCNAIMDGGRGDKMEVFDSLVKKLTQGAAA